MWKIWYCSWERNKHRRYASLISATISPLSFRTAPTRFCVSAKTGSGITDLLCMISERLMKDRRRINLRLPYDRAGMLEFLHREAVVLGTEYREEFIDVDAVIKPELWGQVRAYVRPESSDGNSL